MFRFLDLYAMQSKPYRWRLNMKTGAVREGLLSDTVTEFGSQNASVTVSMPTGLTLAPLRHKDKPLIRNS